MVEISSKNRIDKFLNELQAKKPSPGGGAATALAGAIGISLIMKVANFTAGKKKYLKYERQIRSILNESRRLKDRLSLSIKKDAQLYKKYAETKNKAALKKATLCVASIAEASKEGLKLCAQLDKIGNANFKGDLVAAKALLGASFKAAEGLVKLNKRWLG